MEKRVAQHEEALEMQREVEFMARTTRSVAHDLRNVFTVVNSCAVDLYDEMHGRRAGVLVLEVGHERGGFEAAFARLECAWLETSGGEDCVVLLERSALAS